MKQGLTRGDSIEVCDLKRSRLPEVGVCKEIPEKTFADLLAEAIEERKREEVYKLCRFASMQELAILMGRGKTIKERVEFALKNPDYCKHLLLICSEKNEFNQSGRREIENLLGINSLFDLSCFSDVRGSFSRLRKVVPKDQRSQRPVLIAAGGCAFSVNEPASNYRSSILFNVFLEDEPRTVKDFPEPMKYVPFEPTYVTAPSLFVEEMKFGEIDPSTGCYCIDLFATMLTSDQAKLLRSWVEWQNDSEQLVEEMLKYKKDEDEGDNPLYQRYILGLRATALVDYILAERVSPNNNQAAGFAQTLAMGILT